MARTTKFQKAALLMAVGADLGGSGGGAVGLVIGRAFEGGSSWFSDRIALPGDCGRPVSEAETPALCAMIQELSADAVSQVSGTFGFGLHFIRTRQNP